MAPTRRHRRRPAHRDASRRVASGVLFAALLFSSTGLVAVFGPVRPAAAAVTPVANPPVPDECGLPLTLVLDASGSIESEGAVENVRSAAKAFLDAVKDTGSTARVVDFGTVARQTAPADPVTTASMAPGGVHANALASYYNPKPPIAPPTTAARQYNGTGSISSTSSFGSIDNSQTQWTNWDQALARARTVPSSLIVFVTDGDPTAFDLNQPGDAFNPPGTTVAYNTFRGQGTGPSVDRAVVEANAAKTAGTRILAVGVGPAVGNPSSASVDRLKQVSGPQVVTSTAGITSINQIDVALVAHYADLAALLKQVVTELCSPSLTIRKFVQTADSTTYVPASGWSMTVNPTVAGGTYRWIQPANAPVGPQTVVTNAQGFAPFQWEPNPSTLNSTATVTELVQPGYTPGQAVCEILPPDQPSHFITFPSSASFTVPVGSQDIVTCSLFNNFIYQPGIHLVKTPSATVVRGDAAGTSVTYTYTVTNTGNTPLAVSAPVDDNCPNVVFVGGDTNGDNRLDVTETWTYRCTRIIQAPLSQGDVVVTNTATVNATDPAGTPVSDTDTADVQVLTPAIHLEKSVDQTEVAPGTAVTYTFTVTNQGNDPLHDVTLTDDHCTPTLVSGDTNGDGILDLTETWTYTCTGVITDDPTVNVATVTGTPTVGPDVTDQASASVDVVYEDLNLVKTASENVVYAGRPVTYSYTLTNSGGDPLTPPAGLTHLTAVSDDSCAPVTFVTSSGNFDDILAPGESWTYTCTRTIDTDALNTATSTMQGPLGPITRTDQQFVEALASGIQVVKTASDSLVRAGTPVTYTYDVSNTGDTPLDVVGGVTDDSCAPVTFTGLGDDDGNGLLDPGEVWVFTCTATIDATTINTVTATGIPRADELGPGPPVSDTDTAIVRAFTPGISLTKTPSATLVPLGSPVTFTYVATNTGDADLIPQGLSDDSCKPVQFVGESVSDDNVMQPGEQWTWRCTTIMNADTTNTATVTALDPTGESVDATAQAHVDVFVSQIAITKSADPVVIDPGASTTYTFTVTNPGPVPLHDVTVTDDTCSPITFTGGDTNGDGILAPDLGETWTYTCSKAITKLTTNLATVTGTDPAGGKPTDTDQTVVIPYLPGIAVEKTATPTQVEPGGAVTYRYEVRNTGNVPLADVANRITDNKCAPLTLVSGDTNGNGILEPDTSAKRSAFFEYAATNEVWIFTCTTHVTTDTTNTVTASGIPSDPDGNEIGRPVTATATAHVTVTAGPPVTEEVQPSTPTTQPEVSSGAGSILPRTGASLAALLVAAILLFSAGLFASSARRRRRVPRRRSDTA